jgi:hypothetical protein
MDKLLNMLYGREDEKIRQTIAFPAQNEYINPSQMALNQFPLSVLVQCLSIQAQLAYHNPRM